MVDLGGYVIILVETNDKRVKLYGSPADKADLEVADEILEINGKPLVNSSHTEVINHIHNCIKSRTICLRVKRRTGNKLAEELAENSNVQDAFVIAVEQQARERLEKLSALRKIKPVDMSALSQQLCESPTESKKSTSRRQNPIYSTPVTELGSTHNLSNAISESSPGCENRADDHKASGTNCQDHYSGSGYLTDEELELNQTLDRSRNASGDTLDRSRHSSGELLDRSRHSSGELLDKSRHSSGELLDKSRHSSGELLDKSKRSSVEKLDRSRHSSGDLLNQRKQSSCEPLSRNRHQSGDLLEKTDNNLESKSVSTRDSKLPSDAGKERPEENKSRGRRLSRGSEEASRRSKDQKANHESTISVATVEEDPGSQPKDRPTQSAAQQNTTQNPGCEHSPTSPRPSQAGSKRGSDTFSAKEVLIGGDTDGNRSARSSFRDRHEVKTLTEESDSTSKVLDQDISQKTEKTEITKQLLKPTYSFKSTIDAQEMLRCIERVSSTLSSSSSLSLSSSSNLPSAPSSCLSSSTALAALRGIVTEPRFQVLIQIHNTIQSAQCFQCPPDALCSDSRDLVQECMVDLQQSHLPESAEILDILNKIEFEGLFYSHDKLAEMQVALPWKKCLAEMWTKDRPSPGQLKTDNTRIVKITKHNEPLGATVRNEGEKVVIGRVVKGGAAERSGNLHPGDEVLEVNGLKLKGKSVHDICDTLCQMSGTLTFVIIPANPNSNTGDIEQEVEGESVYHYRAYFTYTPDDDLYIPCHELGISFQRGDILHVISREDPHWWQAYRDGEWTQTLAGLIPSLALQQHRMALQRQKREQEAREQLEAEAKSPSKKKAAAAAALLCAKKTNKRKRHNSPFKKERHEAPPYEEMALYYPQPNQKRPLILAGPPSIGRHELRQRLLEDTAKFAAPVPHTSRSRGEDEIDGADYHFVSRHIFEDDVASGRFVEHGEYDKQYYGTSLDSIRTVINSGKICVLNLQPSSLHILHDSDLKPYVVFLTSPTLQVYKQQKHKQGEVFKEDEFRELVSISHEMEEQFGQYFDSVIPFEDVDFVLRQLTFEISLLEREPQWVPAKWTKDKKQN